MSPCSWQLASLVCSCVTTFQLHLRVDAQQHSGAPPSALLWEGRRTCTLPRCKVSSLWPLSTAGIAGRVESPAASMDLDEDERRGMDAPAAEPSNADQYDPAEEGSGAYRCALRAKTVAGDPQLQLLMDNGQSAGCCTETAARAHACRAACARQLWLRQCCARSDVTAVADWQRWPRTSQKQSLLRHSDQAHVQGQVRWQGPWWPGKGRLGQGSSNAQKTSA